MPLIDPRDVEPCPGVRIGLTHIACGERMDPVGVQGYDGVFRCLACNKIHATDVLEQSGDAAPNHSEDKSREMTGAKKGARIVDAKGNPLAGPEQEKAIERAAKKELRRSSIMKKYGRDMQ